MSASQIKSYRELIVWQKAMNLVVSIYNLTDTFPKTETYGLTSQMRRAAVSIPSNIAEGRRRGSRREFKQFLLNAFGSGAELETQLEIVKLLAFCKQNESERVESLLDEVMRILNSIIIKLQATS